MTTKEFAAGKPWPIVPWPFVPRSHVKTGLFILLVAVIATDLTHSILSVIYSPYQGILDDGMHMVLLAAAPFYLAALYWLASRFVLLVARSSFALPSLVLVAAVVAQLIYSFAVAPRSILAPYRPLFPDFVGGLIIGGLTVATARPFLHSRVVRIVITVIFLMWSLGGFVSDALWFSEGSQRGTGPVWNYPVIGGVAGGFGLLIFATSPIWFMADTGHALHVAIMLWLPIAIACGFFLWRLTSAKVAAIVVALSVLIAQYKLAEWALFVLD